MRSFSLKLEGNDIIATATRDTYPFKKHLMVQAMLQIDDLYVAEPGSVRDFFFEDVQVFLDQNKISYVPRISIIGKSGTNNAYDFVFPKRGKTPERFSKAINRLTESSRNMAIFNWLDTRDVRSQDSQMLVFLNDEIPFKQDDVEAFEAYNIISLPFSNKPRILKALEQDEAG